MPPGVIVLTPAWRIAATMLAVFPVPGVGTMIAGWKNPHTPLLRHGILQTTLVVFGSWPLIFPGAIGLVWACWSASRIWQLARPPGRQSLPL